MVGRLHARQRVLNLREDAGVPLVALGEGAERVGDLNCTNDFFHRKLSHLAFCRIE